MICSTTTAAFLEVRCISIYNGLASGAGLTGSFSRISFDTLNYDLNPNSSYWVVLGGANDSVKYDWGYDATSTLPGGLGGAINNAWTFDGGASWSTDTANNPFVMTVSTVVPEPASGAIVLLLVGAASLRQRRRSDATVVKVARARRRRHHHHRA